MTDVSPDPVASDLVADPDIAAARLAIADAGRAMDRALDRLRRLGLRRTDFGRAGLAHLKPTAQAIVEAQTHARRAAALAGARYGRHPGRQTPQFLLPGGGQGRGPAPEDSSPLDAGPATREARR